MMESPSEVSGDPKSLRSLNSIPSKLKSSKSILRSQSGAESSLGGGSNGMNLGMEETDESERKRLALSLDTSAKF